MKRFNRVSGQLQAVRRMIEEERGYKQTMIQLQAVISALQGIKMEMVQSKIKATVMDQISEAMKVFK